MKERFISLLRSTGRDGIETIITNLEKLGFFNAPASTKFHLSKPGGLLQHSLNVCDMALILRDQMVAMKPELADKLPKESIILVSLLHDICKAEVYKIGKRNVKNPETGRWEEKDVYETDYSFFPAGHGSKSVIRLLLYGLKLNPDEVLAILWHMSAWDIPFQSYETMGNLNAAKDKTPLVGLLMAADNLACTILETDYPSK